MPVLTMALVLATDNSLAQAAASGTILAVFLVVLASLRPWKVPLLNEIDISCSLFILLLLLAGSPLPTTDAEVAKLHAFAASFAATGQTGTLKSEPGRNLPTGCNPLQQSFAIWKAVNC